MSVNTTTLASLDSRREMGWILDPGIYLGIKAGYRQLTALLVTLTGIHLTFGMKLKEKPEKNEKISLTHSRVLLKVRVFFFLVLDFFE